MIYYVCNQEILKKKKEVMKMELTADFGEYIPWAGAIDTMNVIERANKEDELEGVVEEMLGEVASMVEVNDLLWFEADKILDLLGIMSDAERERISEHINEGIASVYEEIEELEQEKAELEADGEDTDSVVEYIKELEDELEYLEGIDKEDDDELEDYRENFMD